MTEFPFVGASTHPGRGQVEMLLTPEAANHVADLVGKIDPHLSKDPALARMVYTSVEEQVKDIRESSRARFDGVQVVDGGWVRAFLTYDASDRSVRRLEVQFPPGQVLAMSTSRVVNSSAEIFTDEHRDAQRREYDQHVQEKNWYV